MSLDDEISQCHHNRDINDKSDYADQERNLAS